jgi:hypothetical protein
MNTAITIALALLGVTALDFAVISQDRWADSNQFGRSTAYGTKLGQKFAQAQDNANKERAARLFETWGEWRLGRIHPMHSRLHDLNSEAARVFPAPSWLTAHEGAPPESNQRR